MKWYLYLGGVGLACAATLYITSCSQQKQVTRAVGLAEKHRNEAIALAKDGVMQRLKAEASDALAKEKAKDSEKANQQVAVLKKRLRDAQSLPGYVQPTSPDDPSAIKDEIIAAQDIEIQSQKEELKQVYQSRDEWKLTAQTFESAYKRSQEAFVAERLAREASQRGARTERWKGRLEGFLGGIAIGFGVGVTR